jgi:tricorn protease-like protein
VDKISSVLSVPIASTSKYKNATYWSDFNNIEEKNFVGTGISNLISNISIGTRDDRIIISGLNDGQRIEVYNINGQLQNRFTANINIENIQVVITGDYIVIVNGIAKRIIFN